MKIVDTHCHLDDPRFDADRAEVIARAREAGVEWMMSIGTGNGPPELECAVRLAEQFPCVFATVGVHPHDAGKVSSETFDRLEELLPHPKVLALGEIGLDYHYNHSPPEVQRAVFTRQLEVAVRAQVPIVIHTREAWADTFTLLEEHWEPAAGGIMHCFSGGPREAERCLSMGFHLSFAGVVTYPKAVELREAVRLTPLDRLLIETDSPYLAPVPHRGKRNEPGFVVHSAHKVAEVREQPVEEISVAVINNWRDLCAPHLP